MLDERLQLVEAAQKKHAIPESTHLLPRYESHITRELSKAIAQLLALQDQRRQGADANTSNGKKSDLKVVG